MVRHRIGGLPVVDDNGQLIGMLGERELIRTLVGALQGARAQPQPDESKPQATVRDAMTRQVLSVSPDQPLAEVTSIMTNKDVDHVPVVRDGRVVGILTRGDIVRKLIGY
jgi:CBS domain-containing protein